MMIIVESRALFKTKKRKETRLRLFHVIDRVHHILTSIISYFLSYKTFSKNIVLV